MKMKRHRGVVVRSTVLDCRFELVYIHFEDVEDIDTLVRCIRVILI